MLKGFSETLPPSQLTRLDVKVKLTSTSFSPALGIKTSNEYKALKTKVVDEVRKITIDHNIIIRLDDLPAWLLYIVLNNS